MSAPSNSEQLFPPGGPPVYGRYLVEYNQNVADIGGESEVSITYAIRRYDGEVIDYTGADYHALSNLYVIPRIGQELEDWNQYATLDVRHPALQFARCRSLSFQSMKAAGGGCFVTCVFKTLYAYNFYDYPDSDPSGQGDIQIELPCNVEYNASLRSINIYRNGWATQPPVNADTSADIGGTGVTSNKGFTNVEVPQVRVRLRIVRDSSAEITSGIYADMVKQADTVSTYLNKINSAEFLKFPAGTVICEGFNMIHLNHEFYEVVIDFLYDAYAHHEQVPDLRADGKIDIDVNSNAKVVKWKRLTRTGADFNNIFGGDVNFKKLVENGWWVP